jgi:hypothetical protein
VDASSQIPEVPERQRQLVAQPLERRGNRRSGRARCPGSHGTQLEGHGHQALLRAVVQVSLDSAALGVGGLDDPGTRGLDLLQLCPQLGVKPLVVERE